MPGGVESYLSFLEVVQKLVANMQLGSKLLRKHFRGECNMTGVWSNWQPRMPKEHMLKYTCGFESHHSHHRSHYVATIITGRRSVKVNVVDLAESSRIEVFNQ